MGLIANVLVAVTLPDGETKITQVQQSDLIYNPAASDMDAEASLTVAALRSLAEECVEQAEGRLREWARVAQAAVDEAAED